MCDGQDPIQNYRNSLGHLIVEQQRQRHLAEQQRVIDEALATHQKYVETALEQHRIYMNELLTKRLKFEFNKINGRHVQKVVQFLKKI